MNQQTQIPSPCISVCTIDEDNGFCRGCFRNLEEVTRWNRYTEEQKRTVLELLDERKKQYTSKSLHAPRQ